MNALRLTRTLAGMAAALAGLPALAQTPSIASDAWQFEFVPYLWLAGVRSDLKLGPLPGSTVSVSSSSVLGALDFGAMGTLEARKGAWGGLLDMQYVKLGVGNQFAGGLLGGYDVKFKQTIATLARLLPRGRWPGVRSMCWAACATSMPTPASTSGRARAASGGRSKRPSGSTDGILGVRAIVPLGDKWSLLGYLDVGHGSATSSWQAIAGASYQYSPTTSLKFGYRYLDYKRDDALLNKAAMGGFYFGAGFKF